MTLQRLSLGSSNKSVKYKTEIKKYTSEEYRLTISDSFTTFTLYSLKRPKTFLVGYHNGTLSKGYALASECCITDLDCNVLECFIPEEEDIEKCLDIFSSILISSLFYEAICRAGTPLSFLTDNIDIVNEFISLCYKHWKLPCRCQPNFYIPTINCTSKEFICRTECKLKGDNVSALIGFEGNRVLLQTDINEIYTIQIPELFNNVDENEGIPRLLRYAFMWILLASKEFEVGFGDDIKMKNSKHDADITTDNSDYNCWIKYPKSIQEALEEVDWDGTEQEVSAIAFSLYESRNLNSRK